jgi:predicted enzyme related to lactoylglutathione lyase
MPNPVVHFEVVGKDATTLTKFYGEAFGWQLEDVMEGSYYMANTGGEGDIPGGIGASPDGGSGHVMFYVQVDDPAAALEKIKSLGGSTVSEPMDVPGGPTIGSY